MIPPLRPAARRVRLPVFLPRAGLGRRPVPGRHLRVLHRSGLWRRHRAARPAQTTPGSNGATRCRCWRRRARCRSTIRPIYVGGVCPFRESRAPCFSWSVQAAQQLQEAQSQAEGRHAGVRMTMPFELSLDDREPMFYVMPELGARAQTKSGAAHSVHLAGRRNARRPRRPPRGRSGLDHQRARRDGGRESCPVRKAGGKPRRKCIRQHLHREGKDGKLQSDALARRPGDHP